MPIRVSIKHRDIKLAASVAMILIFIGVLLLVRSESHAESRAKYYSAHLESIKTDVHAIATLSTDRHSDDKLSDQIRNYRSRLDSTLSTCQKIGEPYQSDKNNQELKDLHSPIDSAAKLCTDLEKVATYALNQATVTENFLTFDSNSLTDSKSAQSNLTKLQETLASTLAGLEKLKSDPMNDPAVPEQITLVQDLQKLAQEANGEQGRLAELANKTRVHQDNFINARTYFWVNTIRITDLEKSVGKLQSQFTKQY